jgi:hypothetical protein
LSILGCRGGTSAAPAATASPFAVAIEGNCAKLHVDEAGPQTVIVLGTYGLDEASAWSGKQTAHAAQALALVRPKERTATMEPALLAGLPLTQSGWIEGDVEVGGGGRGAFWLERVVRTPAALDKGALFEVARDGFTWSGRSWRSSAGRDTLTRGPHTALPVAAMFCGEEHAFSLLASERAVDGTTFVAGRCEDELHRPSGGLHLARYDVRAHAWQRIPTPHAPLFEGPDAIVNAGIVVVSADEAWVHAYRPFRESDHEPGYLLHVAGVAAAPIPFDRPIVSIARSTDGTLWAVAGFSELQRRNPDGRWETTSLPPLTFVDPVPTAIRLLDVQTTAKEVWVHGAVPIVRADGTAGREHVLFTTASWSQPLHCDREKEPREALARSTSKVRLAVVRKSEVAE